MKMSKRRNLMLAGAFVVAGACVTVADETNWILVGVTTRDEVVRQYGPPDLLVVSQEGETATYRPARSERPTPRIEIPEMQAGPGGQQTTRMQQIKPGLGAGTISAGTRRPPHEIRIRYDSRGVVQEVMQ